MKLLIFGGTGSLGHQLVRKYIDRYEIWICSRDETKQWEMKIDNPTVNFLLCDVRDSVKVGAVMQRVQPNIVIIAAAMKHIDRCEEDTHECVATNIIGTKNILENIIPSVSTVCFVSTDKACSPVNVYGMTKGISEVMMIEKSLIDSDRKYITVRYGNVLNSRGSIIPTLHAVGQNPRINNFQLTHLEMTRFIMTLEQSVDLIEHAITSGCSGDIVIPKLVSMKVKDLLDIFSEIYNKPVNVTTMRPGEKMLESLINETQSRRLVKGPEYMYVKPRQVFPDNEICDYNSSLNQLSRTELSDMLRALNLL